MSNQKRKVLIATPAYGGMVTEGYSASLLQTIEVMRELGIAYQILGIGNESLITRGRNRCSQHLLNSDATDLFFIDADISWTPRQFLDILLSKKHVIGGTYPLKMVPLNLNYNLLPEDRVKYQTKYIKTPEDLRKLRVVKGSVEVEVQHIPTGFMRISRETLEYLKEKVPRYYIQNPRNGKKEWYYDFFWAGVKYDTYMSEDWFFCELCRDHKIPVFLNTVVIVQHTGTYNYGEQLKEYKNG